jgi:hypothetical protein
MKVSLPQDAWANLKSKGEISERVSRELGRTLMESSYIADKLNKAGFDDADASTYHLYAQLTPDEQTGLNAIQTVLIRSFTTSWSFEQPITDDAIVDLPKPVYDALAEACLKEWTREDDPLDPKASTGD